MGKLALFLIGIMFMQVGLLLFANSGSTGYTEGSIVSTETDSSTLTEIFLDPSNLFSSKIYIFLVGILGTVSAATLFLGSVIFKSDRFMYISLTATFFTFS
jgi:hypothetical protein